MQFRFRGIRQTDGENVVSTFEAADADTARRELAERGIDVREIYPAPDEVPIGPGRDNPDGLLAILSLLMPLGGFIAGAIFLVSDHPSDRRSGRMCLIISLISCIIWLIIVFAAAS
jgi:hypothetical protein